MAVNQFTYQQLDNVLSQLGFTRHKANARNRTWLYYELESENAAIIIIDQPPEAPVHEVDAIAARRQLIEKGLVSDAELDDMLSTEPSTRQNPSVKTKKK